VASDKELIFGILFWVSDKKEVIETICYTFGKNAMIRMICKNCYERYRGGNFNLKERVDQRLNNLKTGNRGVLADRRIPLGKRNSLCFQIERWIGALKEFSSVVLRKKKSKKLICTLSAEITSSRSYRSCYNRISDISETAQGKYLR